MIESSGSQTCIVGQWHTLAAPTTAGTRVLEVDLSTLANGDTVEIATWSKAHATSAMVRAYTATYSHAQAEPLQYSTPITVGTSAMFRIRQTAGTGRAFSWSVENVDGVADSVVIPAVESTAYLGYIIGNFTSTSTKTDTFTFGTESATRQVVVAARTVSSVVSITIGGVAATIDYATTAGITFAHANVPTGTSGNVSITIATAGTQWQYAVWCVYGASSLTAYDSDVCDTFGSSVVKSMAVSTVPGGVLLALGYIARWDAASNSFTWTGISERWDKAIGSATGWTSGGEVITDESNAVVTVTNYLTESTNAAVISLAPGP